jgi:hypothetical protein
MKLVMTLLVRDEVDVIDTHLAYHLNAGIDFVVATDHRSRDGTTEILDSYRRDGHLRLIRMDDEWIRQSEWVTRMARLAASEHDAEWVINSDADEFWCSLHGSLKDVLSTVPAKYGAVSAFSHFFVPRAGDGPFAERMTVRLASVAPVNDPATPFRPVAKAAHRAHRAVVVEQGNHAVSAPGLRPLRGWFPIDVLHFPIRSREQIARKHENTVTAWRENLRGDLARARVGLRRGQGEAFFERLALPEQEVERGLASGLLVRDVRLRDALASLEDRSSSGRTQAPDGHHGRSLDVSFGALLEADEVRLQRRLDEIASRVDRLERRR